MKLRWVHLIFVIGLVGVFVDGVAGQVLVGSRVPEKKLLLVDVKDQGKEVEFLVGALQGLVNRASPRIYLDDARYEGGQDVPLAAKLRDWSIPVLEMRGHTFEKVSDWRALLAQFKTSYKGAIIYDAAAWSNPDIADQINVVTALAGVHDLLPVTEALNQTLKLPVVMDVRGRWKSAEDAYHWAVTDEAFRRSISKRALAHRHPWSNYMTDYLVAQSILPVWVGKEWGSDDSLAKLQRDLFALTATNTPVLGAWESWWPRSPQGSALTGMDELALVKLISASGKFLIPVVSYGNFSVHSGIDVPEIKQKAVSFRRFDPEKVYVAFIASDGDNVSGFTLIRPLLWKDPARGKVPMGWTFPPALVDLAPHVLASYYADASDADCFIGGCSGVGYMMAGYGAATGKGEECLSQYLELTKQYLAATDAKLSWNWWMDDATTKAFAAKTGVEGIFLEPEPFKGSYRDSIRLSPGATSRPVVLVNNSGSAGSGIRTDKEVDDLVALIKRRAGGLDRPRFVFAGFNGLNGSPSNVAKVIEKLPEDYVAVRPDELVALYRQSLEHQADQRRYEERLVFQTHANYSPRLHLNADVAINYGIDKSLPDRIATWKGAGFGIHCMTGVAWGAYQDYLYGRWDGVKHEDEAQTDKTGAKISHGGDVFYMSPAPTYGQYLASGVKRAIDSGATAIHLEEPEFWVKGGYEESFKREWKKEYKEEWKPLESSVDAQWRASKLKYLLYRRALGQVFDFTRNYSREIGREVNCYVASHSLLSYAQWGIVSPESSLLDVGCDGYIAQVWTGTARTPNVYNGVKKERSFETGYLEYGQMVSMLRGSGRKLWLLHDPVEDNPEHSWSDYRRNYESTVVASLLHPDVWRYEIAPWPERVWMRKYPKAEGKGELESIPAEYETELQLVMTALGDMRQGQVKWEVAGTRGVGVVVSDTMMFQRGNPTPSDADLSSFYGLAMPLVKSGIPVVPAQLENFDNGNYLDAYKVLVLTYEGQKPLTSRYHELLASWVKAGGALVVIDDDKDPYHAVSEWWNGKSHHYKTPRVHLFQQLGVAADAVGVHRVEKGAVVYVAASPAKLAHDASGGEKVRDAVRQACETVGLKYEEAGALVLRRGPYVIAATLDESVSGGAWSRVIKGRYISLLDGKAPTLIDPAIEAGKQYLLVDVGKHEGPPRVLAAAGRVRDVKSDASSISFKVDGVEKTQGLVCVSVPAGVREVTVDGKAAEHEVQDGVVRVNFENRPAGVDVKVLLK